MFRILIITLVFVFHPVHVSRLSIDYSSDDEAFNCVLVIYFDDFLTDYASIPGNTTRARLAEGTDTAKIIREYINERLVFIAGRVTSQPEIASYLLADNELTINFIYKVKGSSGEYAVRNEILADIYGDQANLIIFRYGEFEEGVKLIPEKREYVFRIKQ